jgi:protein MAK11
MSLLYSVTHAARIHDILFVEEGKESKHSVLLVAAENKKVSAYLVLSSPPQPEIQEDNDDEEEVSTLKVFAECIGHSNRRVESSLLPLSVKLTSCARRVKALASLCMALPVSPTQTRSYTTILTTISSDGKVLVYDLAPLASAASASSSSEAATEASEILQLSPVAEYDSAGSRLTCLTVAEDTTAVATSTTGLGAVRNLTGDTKPADGEEAGSAFDAAVEGSDSEDDEELEGEDEEEMEEEDEEEDEA